MLHRCFAANMASTDINIQDAKGTKLFVADSKLPSAAKNIGVRNCNIWTPNLNAAAGIRSNTPLNKNAFSNSSLRTAIKTHRFMGITSTTPLLIQRAVINPPTVPEHPFSIPILEHGALRIASPSISDAVRHSCTNTISQTSTVMPVATPYFAQNSLSRPLGVE